MTRRPRRTWNVAMSLGLAVLQVSASGASQQSPGVPETQVNEQKAQELLNDGKHTFDDLLHGEPGAVANARNIFDLTTEPALKQRLASILLSIGQRDKRYEAYLEHAAREALADATPWPLKYDEKGEPKDWDPVFLEWCKTRGLMPWATLKKASYETPGPWLFLAASGDPNFYGLFMEGLHSHNLMIVAMAALGLAKLQDPRAIDILIKTGHQTVGEARIGIGQALLCFSEPRAQAAAEEFFGDDKKLFEMERQLVKEKGIKGLGMFNW